MSNQENKADNGKHDPTLLMHDLGKALKAVTAVLNYGAEKYEPRGWKTVEPRRYQSALLRHYNDKYVGNEEKDEESGLLHLAHLATNALFLLQMHIENRELGPYTTKDLYIYNKPPQNHKKNTAPEITETVLAPDDTFRITCTEPDYAQVGDYQFLIESEKQASPRSEDAFELPKQREGYRPECCHKTVLKRCKGCPYGEVESPKARTVCSNDCYFNHECGAACPYGR